MDWSENSVVIFVYGASTILASVLLVLTILKFFNEYIKSSLLGAYRTINRLGKTDRHLGFVQGVRLEHFFYWSKRSRRELWFFAFVLPLPIVIFKLVPLSVAVILFACWIILSAVAMVNPMAEFTIDPFTWEFVLTTILFGAIAVTAVIVQTLFNAVKPFDLAVRDFTRRQRHLFERRTHGDEIAPKPLPGIEEGVFIFGRQIRKSVRESVVYAY